MMIGDTVFSPVIMCIPVGTLIIVVMCLIVAMTKESE